MKRGDIVLASAPGDFGKPRPAVVVQSDFFNNTHASIAVCLITSDIQNAPLFRISVEPTVDNGLSTASQIMIDKIVALKRSRITTNIGRLNETRMIEVNRSLAMFLGLGDQSLSN